MKNAFFALLVVAFLGIGSVASAGDHCAAQAIVVQNQALFVNPFAVQAIVAPQAIVVQQFPQRIVVRQPQRIVVQRQLVRQKTVIRGPLGGRITIVR